MSDLAEGWRNNGLTSYAGSLRARGFERGEILIALREANQTRCTPPLPDPELRNIAKSAARWKPYPTRRGGQQRTERVVHIPEGCFDPRPAVCGFDAVAIVESDTSLGLWRNHRALYAFLVGVFGPWGCHPALRTIGETLGMPHQHVVRHVARLERAGLILVEAGDYRRTERKFAARCYHFQRHALFAEHFTRNGLPVFSDIEGFCHQCEEFSTGEIKSRLENQQVTEILSHRGDVVPITQRGNPLSTVVSEGSEQHTPASSISTRSRALLEAAKKKEPALSQRKIRAEIEPFAFETAPGYYAITLYLECAARCGGARIVYSDGTLKRYECSCSCETAVVAVAS